MEYLEVLKKDKLLAKIIREPLKLIKHENDLYLQLLKAIAGQQLSTKAASTIWLRFESLFNSHYPDAIELLTFHDSQLRAVGFSYQKAGYLKNIANFHLQNNLNSLQTKRMQTEKLIEYLTQIKGVGTWTVEMVLMFSLNKKDIFPVDDLGIQNAMKMIYKLPESKKEMKNTMLFIAENWRPFRTYACFYLWQHKDTKPILNKH